MYLKRLELFGFKSFPDKTILTFDSGITVIVGPNGCGKSNVFDAIKWALGEQSPKSLRGSKMEDVIFNGTQSHPPLNYSEVTLTFSNEDNYLPIDYKEVAVARRLYRSGESNYFVNKNTARLKDVNDLFMGTGVGESSYSFIEQGKVEALLSYKPEEKRLILDEASGIVKYKEKKKETLRKLKDTDDNILRLDDIIAEVRRQTRYLERQVEKAKKYKEINQQLIAVEKDLATVKLSDLEKKIKEILDAVNVCTAQKEEKEARIKEKNHALDETNSTLKTVRLASEEATAKIISKTSHIENYFNHIEINKQRVQEFTTRIMTVDNSIQDAAKRVALHTSRIDQEKQSIDSLDTTIGGLEQGLVDFGAERQNVVTTIKEAGHRIQAAKENIMQFEEKRVSINNTLIEVAAALKNLFAHKKRLLLDKARIDNCFAERKEVIQEVAQAVIALQAQCDALKSDRSALNAKLREVDSSIDTSIQEMIEKEKALVELNSYLSFLKDLRSKYEEFPMRKRVTITFDEEPQEINKLIASLKDVTFEKVIKDGRLTYQAQVEAKIISLPEEELMRRIDVLTLEVSSLKNAIEESKSTKTSLDSKISEQDISIAQADNLLRDKLKEQESLNEEMARFKEEDELTEKDLNEALAEIEETETKKVSLERDLLEIEQSLNTSREELQENQKILTDCSKELNRLDIETTKAEAEIKALKEHKESFFSKLALLEEEKNNLISALATLNEDKQRYTQRIDELQVEAGSLKEKITDEQKQIESLNVQKKSSQDELNTLEESLNELYEAQSGLEKQLESVKTEIYNKRLAIQSLDFEKTKIFDYLKQVYNITFVPEHKETPGTLDALEEQRNIFKKKLDNLGEVNLVAIEEFEELNSRFTFLNTQREDLLTSKENLKKAIQKINRTSKEVFLEVFAKVEESFKKYFRFLFGGGRANLILLDRDDVLESGVEIEVQPPGKKLQNVSLLSGGEKALTAIALIFSIFKVRPSPLCVLDEIDAPLDEANVDRFNQLLKEFAPTSQFIIITHNKRTMSKADVLYGVTMEEKGISKLVSVRFADEEPAEGPTPQKAAA